MTDLDNPNKQNSLDTNLPFLLSSRQQILYESFSKKNKFPTQIYYGALHVLASQNPDKYALASHNFRELLNEIPKYLGFDIAPYKQNISQRAIDLSTIWFNTKKKSKCLSDETFSGEIDSPLKIFLDKCNDFFIWLEDLEPRRKQTTKKVLNELNQSPMPLPPNIEEIKIKEWVKLYEYFANLAHHEQMKKVEFEDKVNQFEIFLVNCFYPQTFTDMNEIDEIIKIAEQNDRA